MLFILSCTTCWGYKGKSEQEEIIEKYPKLKRYKPQMQNGRFYIEIKDLTDLLQLRKDTFEDLVITRPYGTDKNTPEVEIEIYDGYRE